MRAPVPRHRRPLFQNHIARFFFFGGDTGLGNDFGGSLTQSARLRDLHGGLDFDAEVAVEYGDWSHTHFLTEHDGSGPLIDHDERGAIGLDCQVLQLGDELGDASEVIGRTR